MFTLPDTAFHRWGLMASAALTRLTCLAGYWLRRNLKVSLRRNKRYRACCLRRKHQVSDLLFQETLLFSLPLFIPFDLTLVASAALARLTCLQQVSLHRKLTA